MMYVRMMGNRRPHESLATGRCPIPLSFCQTSFCHFRQFPSTPPSPLLSIGPLGIFPSGMQLLNQGNEKISRARLLGKEDRTNLPRPVAVPFPYHSFTHHFVIFGGSRALRLSALL